MKLFMLLQTDKKINIKSWSCNKKCLFNLFRSYPQTRCAPIWQYMPENDFGGLSLTDFWTKTQMCNFVQSIGWNWIICFLVFLLMSSSCSALAHCYSQSFDEQMMNRQLYLLQRKLLIVANRTGLQVNMANVETEHKLWDTEPVWWQWSQYRGGLLAVVLLPLNR